MTRKQIMRGRRTTALSLALLVALAFGAIAASGAQALDWQYPNNTALSGSETVAGTGSGFNITSTLLGQSVEVKCSSASTSGSIVGGGTGTSSIGLGGCTVSKPAHCSLAAQPTLSSKVELVQAGGALFQKFVPAGTEFATLTFVGAECPLNEAAAPLKGSFAGRELSTELTANHSLSLTKTEPWPSVELKLGSKAATITGEVMQHLSGGLANHGWRAIPGGWEVEGGSPFTGSETVKTAGGPVDFTWTMLGAKKSITCSEASAGGAVVAPGGTETISAPTFSGCKVESPANCSLPGNKLQFSGVTGTLSKVSGRVYEKFVPTATTSFFALHFEGASCSDTETVYEAKGSYSGLGPEFTLFKSVQPLEFSEAANSATGSQMTIGKSIVNMTGTIKQELSGLNAGRLWGAF